MSKNFFRNILSVLIAVAAGPAFAGQIDVTADTSFVAKPRARVSAPKPVDKTTAKTSAVPVPKPLVGPNPASTQWVQTMEASVGPFSTRGTTALTEETGYRPVFLWLGWGFAGLFGFVLVAQGLRNRRRNLRMVRAGERDSFYLPPSHRRR